MNRQPIPQSVEAKLSRAQIHRTELEDVLSRYVESSPYSIEERLADLQGRRYRVQTATITKAVPLEAGLILGDLAHNLRAGLDHLAGQLLPSGPTDKTAFPICTEWDGDYGFHRVARRRLAGAPGETIEAIALVQPIIGDASRDVFRSLRAVDILDRVDKHRSLLLGASVMAPGWVGHNRQSDEPSGIVSRIEADGRAEWWLPLDDRDQHFDPRFEIDVRLRRPESWAADWPDWIERWELLGLAEYLCRAVTFEIVLPVLAASTVSIRSLRTTEPQ